MTDTISIHSDRAPVAVSTISPRSAEAPIDYAKRVLERHHSTIEVFKEARRSSKTFDAFLKTPGYAALARELRSAAVEFASSPSAPYARALIDEAARAMALPTVDIEHLSQISAHLVSQGQWRPRSVNVAFLKDDAASRAVPRDALQKRLNKMSEWLPDVREYEVFGLRNVYSELSPLLPVVEFTGDAASRVLSRTAKTLAGWSDATASEAQRSLRSLRLTLLGNRVVVPPTKDLSEEETQVLLAAAKVAAHQVTDIERVIDELRTSKGGSSPKGVSEHALSLTSSTLFFLSRFVDGVDRWVRNLTREDAWRTFTVHIQLGMGLEKLANSSRFAGVFMMPTLDQVEKEGAAKVRVNFKATAIDTLAGSLFLSSRGGGYMVRVGTSGASVNDFEHEFRVFQLPGICNFALGEDYSYGPMVSLGYSPKIDELTGKYVNVRVAPNLKIYHGALRPLTAPTRTVAEEFTIGSGLVRNFAGRWKDKILHRKRPPIPTKDGWPTSQLWLVAKNRCQRAELAKKGAESRLAQLTALDTPEARDKFVERAIAAGLSEHEARALPDVARAFLETMTKDVDRQLTKIRGLAKVACEVEPFPRSSRGELRRSWNRLTRMASTYEFVDLLLSRVLGDFNVPGVK